MTLGLVTPAARARANGGGGPSRAPVDPEHVGGMRPPGEVLAASINDVIGEVLNLVTRSEVGLLDVAWSIQESETEEIRRLDRNRARDLREIERNLEQGLGELE